MRVLIRHLNGFCRGTIGDLDFISIDIDHGIYQRCPAEAGVVSWF